MRRFIITIATSVLLATTSLAAILVFSPNGIHVNNPSITTITQATTAPDIASDEVVVTSNYARCTSCTEMVLRAALSFHPSSSILMLPRIARSSSHVWGE